LWVSGEDIFTFGGNTIRESRRYVPYGEITMNVICRICQKVMRTASQVDRDYLPVSGGAVRSVCEPCREKYDYDK